MDTETTAQDKPKAGRPPGYAKTGGRKKGVPNRKTVLTREAIGRLADPLLFLCTVAAGKRFLAAGEADPKKRTWHYPSPEQRLSAATTLARKLVPDMRAVEVSGGTDGSLIIHLVSHLDKASAHADH